MCENIVLLYKYITNTVVIIFSLKRINNISRIIIHKFSCNFWLKMFDKVEFGIKSEEKNNIFLWFLIIFFK
jgi:hypothetical protein